MNYLLAIVFVTAWTLTLIFLGVAHLSQALGGALVLFFLQPFIALSSIKLKQLTPILFSFLIAIVGLTIGNYLHHVLMFKEANTGMGLVHLLLYTYIFFFPGWVLTCGTMFIIHYFFRFDKTRHDDDFDLAVNAQNYLCMILLVFLCALVPICFYAWHLIDQNKSIGINIALGILAFVYLFFMIETVRIERKSLNYFLRVYTKFSMDVSLANRYLIAGTLVLVAISGLLEYLFRNQWWVWLFSMVIVICNNLILMKFWGALFMPDHSRDERPATISLPTIKSKKLFIMLIIYIVLWIIAIGSKV